MLSCRCPPFRCRRRCRPQKFGLDSSEDLTFGLVCMMLLDFLYLFLASAVLGMMFGLVTAYCLRHFHFHHVSQARWLCCWAAGWAACRCRSCAGSSCCCHMPCATAPLLLPLTIANCSLPFADAKHRRWP